MRLYDTVTSSLISGATLFLLLSFCSFFLDFFFQLHHALWNQTSLVLFLKSWRSSNYWHKINVAAIVLILDWLNKQLFNACIIRFIFWVISVMQIRFLVHHTIKSDAYPHYVMPVLHHCEIAWKKQLPSLVFTTGWLPCGPSCGQIVLLLGQLHHHPQAIFPFLITGRRLTDDTYFVMAENYVYVGRFKVAFQLKEMLLSNSEILDTWSGSM